MLRYLAIPAFVLFSWSCGVAEADHDPAMPSCDDVAASECVARDDEETANAEPPTITGTAKKAASWVKERTLRRLRVDPDAYPQRLSG